MHDETKFLFPNRNPRVRVLCYPDYLEEIKSGLVEILDKNETTREKYVLRSGEPFSVIDEHRKDPLVLPLFLTFDIWKYANDTSTLITLGGAILGVVKYLKSKRDTKRVHRFTVNCPSTYYLAWNFLRNQGVAIGTPLYYHSFGYECLMITRDSKNNRTAHVVIFSNEGEVTDYTMLSL
jgi:hypothetical protein